MIKLGKSKQFNEMQGAIQTELKNARMSYMETGVLETVPFRVLNEQNYEKYYN